MNITDQIQNKEVKQSFRIVVEKLDGGFISDITGKRKIFQHADEIVDLINMNKVLSRVEDDVYHLNVDLIPKSEYEDYMDLLELQKPEKVDDTITYEEAKDKGIITVDTFDPNPIKNEPVIEKEIVVTAETAYKTNRLKSIDWKYFDEQLPLTASEKADISGLSLQVIYAQFRKAKEGKSTFHLSKTRIGFTVLAKYYEANLDIRTSTKDNMDKMKDSVLISLRELELMAAKAKFVYSTEVNKKIEEMRKHLGV